MIMKKYTRCLTIALTQEQHRRTKLISDIQEVSLAHVIREMIDFSLTQSKFKNMENKDEK